MRYSQPYVTFALDARLEKYPRAKTTRLIEMLVMSKYLGQLTAMPDRPSPFIDLHRVRFSEAAIAVRRLPAGESEPVVAFEGTLHDLVLWYSTLGNSERKGVVVHLPDRRTKPFTYSDHELRLLANQLQPR